MKKKKRIATAAAAITLSMAMGATRFRYAKRYRRPLGAVYHNTVDFKGIYKRLSRRYFLNPIILLQGRSLSFL